MALKIYSSIKRNKTNYYRQEYRVNLDYIHIIKDLINNEICIEIDNIDSVCHTGDLPKVHFPLNPDQAMLLGNMLISMAKEVSDNNQNQDCIDNVID